MSATSPQLHAFGRTLRTVRRARELSQEALAHRADLSPKHIGEIERGNKDLRFTTLERLAGGLGMRTSELLAAHEQRTDG